MLPIESSQSGRSGAIAPNKNARLTIGTLGNALSKAAVIKKCEGVFIEFSQTGLSHERTLASMIVNLSDRSSKRKVLSLVTL